MRAVSADGWGVRKLCQWESRSALSGWHESWAEHTDAALDRASVGERIDHRSHADRGVEDEPTIKEDDRARRRLTLGLSSKRVAKNPKTWRSVSS